MAADDIRFETFDGLGDVLVRRGSDRARAILLFHGAGLEPTHKLYTSLMRACRESDTVIAPFLSASHFLAFGKNLRDHRGWADHDPARAVDEAGDWLTHCRRLYGEIVVMGHSWGAYLASQLDDACPLCLVSPVPSLAAIVDTNQPSDYPAEPQRAWLTTAENAPFPVLGRSLVECTKADLSIATRLAARGGRTLILFGEKEHPKISEWTDALADIPQISLKRAEREGHFYSLRGRKLANALYEWLDAA